MPPRYRTIPLTVSCATLGAMLTIGLMAGAEGVAGPGGALNAPVKRGQTAAELAVAANDVLGLSASTVQPVAIDAAAGGVSAALVLDGQPVTLQMSPHSVRAEGFELRAQLADGSWVTPDPGPERTLRGTVDGLPGAVVAGSLLDDGLWAMVLHADGARHWIEPLAGRVAGAALDDHAIYRNDDVLPTGASCGLAAGLGDGFGLGEAGAGQGAGGIAGGGAAFLCTAELATDADVEYFNDYGSVQAVQDQISLVINTMNVQYETQVEITHELTTMLVRTAEPDPYSSTNNNDITCEFITEWTNNQQAIQRDAAQFFTGKEVAGSVIGQAADIGATGVCVSQGSCTGGQFGTQGSYCFVQSDFNNNLGCATDLSAHELGHLWGAFHCACSNPPFTMNSGITCANSFSAGSISSITAYRDSRPCIECLGALTYDFPNGLPAAVDPAGGTTVRVEVLAGSGTPQPGTGVVHISVDGGGFVSTAMNVVSPNVYDAVFPAADCASVIEYFFSAETTTAVTVNEPLGAPTDVFATFAGTTVAVVLADDFESDLGWAVSNIGLDDGQWDRGVPIGGGDRGDPPLDADGSGQCYLTDNVDGNSDVDGGSTTLTSPILDASVGTPVVSYFRWHSNSTGDNPFTEPLTVEISDDGGSSWTVLETVGPGGGEVSGGWIGKSFNLIDAGLAATSQFRIRFTTQDPLPGAIVESGIDGVVLSSVECDPVVPCSADLDGDGLVATTDLLDLLAAWGTDPGGPPDFDGDNDVGTTDLLALLAAWGPCP